MRMELCPFFTKHATIIYPGPLKETLTPKPYCKSLEGARIDPLNKPCNPKPLPYYRSLKGAS